MQLEETTPRKSLKIRMDLDYHSFDNHKKQEFLEELSRLAGVPVDQFFSVNFRRGCVIFEAKLDKEAVIRLVELFVRRGELDPSGEMAEFEDFVQKYSVLKITDDVSYRIHIFTKRKSEDRHVVFVHGWRGDKNSFGKMPEFIADSTGCESLVYTYPSGLWEGSPSINYVARNLDHWIRNRTNGGKLAIVAHSMGGLVARKLIVSQAWRGNPLDEGVSQLTLIASPNNGVPLAKLANNVPSLEKAQLRELEPDSPFLVDLNQQWARWSQLNVPTRCHVRCIYGTADKVVSTANASSLDSDAVPMLNADHRGIVKVKLPDDEIVITLARLLREAGIAYGDTDLTWLAVAANQPLNSDVEDGTS